MYMDDVTIYINPSLRCIGDTIHMLVIISRIVAINATNTTTKEKKFNIPWYCNTSTELQR